MATNIFRDPTTSIPKNDPQIVRVPMTENQIGGRTDHLPTASANVASISHLPNRG